MLVVFVELEPFTEGGRIMLRRLFCQVLLIVSTALSLVFPVLAGDPETTQSTTWGRIKAEYRGEAVAGDSLAGVFQKTLGPVSEVVIPSEPPWCHPAAVAATQKYGINPNDILAVQRVVALRNGIPVDSADVVVTEGQWYYSSLTDGSLSDSPPQGFALLTEIDIYGSDVEMVRWASVCWKIHWAVTFYLPVCFYELWPNRFDGIVDAWAPIPCCDPLYCNGGLCALYQCGCAWNGPGYLEWWNFHQSCSDPRASKKVGKIVQKRWLHTWQLCYHLSNQQIARLVRARIRY